jgi:hypothetical protein
MKKMKTHHAPEDIMLKGVSFINLHNIVVLKDKGTVYSPKLTNSFDSELIGEIVDFSDDPAGELGFFFNDRVIIQYAGYWEGIDGEKPYEAAYSHAACLAKYENEVFLLDCAEDRVINLSRDAELTKTMLHALEYLNMFEMEMLTPEQSVVDALASVFERIYSG